MRKHQDEVDRHHWPTHSIDGLFTPLMDCLQDAVHLYAYGIIFKMDCKRLKRDKDDGVRAGGEGNVTACLVVPLMEEQIPGMKRVLMKGLSLERRCS